MTTSHWHRIYTAEVAAPPALLFDLLSDLPNYPRWLPPSSQYEGTTDVEPYPVQLGSRYHDGKPSKPGSNWWGSVTGFERPGSLGFHHTIAVRLLRATIEVDIRYSFEAVQTGTHLARSLELEIAMPGILRPLRPLITRAFDRENVRTMHAVKDYAEAHPDGIPPSAA